MSVDGTSGGRIAALPMYDVPDAAGAHDAFWSAIAERLQWAGLTDVPARLSRDLDFVDSWRHPGLLLGQACEYPLAKFHASHVRIVATPSYRADGCEGFRYRSLIVVRRDDPAATLADLRGRRCAINDPDSNSGMNLLRVTIAPLAAGGRFFESVQVSGSHWRSAIRVANGEADIASLDCVSVAHLQRCDPAMTAKLRVLARTPASPCLPYVTSRLTDDDTLIKLRAALTDVCADPALAQARECLFLTGVDTQPAPGFAQVLAYERQAIEAGYPLLA